MSYKNEAIRVLDIEANSILGLKDRLTESFDEAVNLLLRCEGKVVLTGMGKSGQIARKIASTLSSTGTSAVFLHPAESSHGDLGVIKNDDVVIAISYSGESSELAQLLKFTARRNISLISMTSKKESSLGSAGVWLDISVDEEACPLRLAPTSSSTATLALGDALAMCVLKERGFQKENFAEFHPGGSLGRRLLTRVSDLMHKGDALPLVSSKETIATVISKMTSKEVRGVAGVLNKDNALVGVITDGDIRRKLEKGNLSLTASSEDIMSRNPKTIDSSEMAEKALFVMEQFQIQILFVVNKKSDNPQQPTGILHLQDLLKANIR